MKKLFSILSLSVLAIVAQAQQPIYAPQSISLTSIMPLAASTASNLNSVIDVRKQKDVAFQVTMANKSTGTANVGLCFASSVDGITYGGQQFVVLLPTANAATNTYVTNIVTLPTSFSQAGYWKLLYVTNANASGSDVTNMFLSYGIKISAP